MQRFFESSDTNLKKCNKRVKKKKKEEKKKRKIFIRIQIFNAAITITEGALLFMGWKWFEKKHAPQSESGAERDEAGSA
jgi:plasmid maintenance system killer protein